MTTRRTRLVSHVTRRFPFLSGCATFAHSKMVRLAAGETKGEVWTRLDNGMEILVSLDDLVGRAAYFVGDYDRRITTLARGIVRPGDQVLDIGANIGIVTMQLSQLVGDGGLVHAFEPNPATNSLLMQSIERNKIQNVRLNLFALGEREATLPLSFPSSNLGSATLKTEFVGAGWSQVEVPVKVLSDVADKSEFGHIRFLKIDVEGFELDVFRGAERWLSADRPDAIVFETVWTPEQMNQNPVVSLLAEYGYQFYTIPKSLFSIRLVPHRPGLDPVSHDMLAVRKDRADEVVSKFSVKG